MLTCDMRHVTHDTLSVGIGEYFRSLALVVFRRYFYKVSLRQSLNELSSDNGVCRVTMASMNFPIF